MIVTHKSLHLKRIWKILYFSSGIVYWHAFCCCLSLKLSGHSWRKWFFCWDIDVLRLLTLLHQTYFTLIAQLAWYPAIQKRINFKIFLSWNPFFSKYNLYLSKLCPNWADRRGPETKIRNILSSRLRWGYVDLSGSKMYKYMVLMLPIQADIWRGVTKTVWWKYSSFYL